MRQDIEPITIIDTEFLQTATRQACLLLRASGSAFYVCKAAPNQTEHADAFSCADASSCADAFSCAASYGTMQKARAGQLLAELLGRVCERRQAMTETGTGSAHENASASLLAVPAVWRDRVHGVLVVTDDLPGRRFNDQDAALLESLAEMTAAALRQAERLTRMTAQFRALHTIDVALTSSLQLDRVLNLILEKAIGLVGAEHGSLRLLNPDTGELVLKAYLGDGWTPEIRAYTFQSGHGIVGWVAENLQPYLCPDAHSDPQNILLFHEMRSGVAVPLLRRPGEAAHGAHRNALASEHDELLGQPILMGGPILMGVLLLESTRLAAFDRRDVELLEALAQEAIIAIQNATQHHELQSMHDALQDEQERRIAAEKWTVMGQAATALAHRINNLIGILPASAAEIRRTVSGLEIAQADRDWIEANLQRIERNGQFILKLADALFRPFQEPGPRARFDVNRLLNEALRAANLPPNIQVIREFGEDLPAVESNSLLVDIFLELITNARKAMCSGAHEGQSRAELRVCTGVEADDTDTWVTITIHDTGSGITPEQMAHLWDMFKQSESGLGFGLWWARTFLERQGGTISCESAPGAGATFSVQLPAHTGVGA